MYIVFSENLRVTFTFSALHVGFGSSKVGGVGVGFGRGQCCTGFVYGHFKTAQGVKHTSVSIIKHFKLFFNFSKNYSRLSGDFIVMKRVMKTLDSVRMRSCVPMRLRK